MGVGAVAIFVEVENGADASIGAFSVLVGCRDFFQYQLVDGAIDRGYTVYFFDGWG